MHVAASAVVGAGGAFVTAAWEGGGATAAVVGTLRTDGDGLADELVPAVAGAVLVAAVTAGAVVGGAEVVLVLCETVT
jgi:hypothetical protein